MINCVLCGSCSGNVEDLEIHIAERHVNNWKAFECEQCKDAKFPTEYALRQHCLIVHRLAECYVRYKASAEFDRKRAELEEYVRRSKNATHRAKTWKRGEQSSANENEEQPTAIPSRPAPGSARLNDKRRSSNANSRSSLKSSRDNAEYVPDVQQHSSHQEPVLIDLTSDSREDSFDSSYDSSVELAGLVSPPHPNSPRPTIEIIEVIKKEETLDYNKPLKFGRSERRKEVTAKDICDTKAAQIRMPKCAPLNHINHTTGASSSGEVSATIVCKDVRLPVGRVGKVANGAENGQMTASKGNRCPSTENSVRSPVSYRVTTTGRRVRKVTKYSPDPDNTGHRKTMTTSKQQKSADSIPESRLMKRRKSSTKYG